MNAFTDLIKARWTTSRLLSREVIQSFFCEIKRLLVNRFQALEVQRQNRQWSDCIFVNWLWQLLRMNSYTNDSVSGKGSHASSLETTVIINCSIVALLILVSIIGNLLVLAAIKRTPSLLSPSIIFICSLAVSDLVVGFLVQPLFIAHELTKLHLVKLPLETTAYAACGFSLCIMTAICLDRYVALHYHLRYPTLMTTSRAIYLVAAVCLINFLVAIIYFWNRTVYLYVMATGICMCLLTSLAFYVRIYQIVRRHQIMIHAQQQAVQCGSDATTQMNMTRLKRSVINTFVFFIVIVVCYFPKVISLAIYNLSLKNWNIAWKFANTAIFMNSSINPILYCWRLRELRTAVFKTIRQLFCRKLE